MEILLTKKEIASRLQISVRSLDVLRSKRGLPTIMVGGQCRFRESEVFSFVDQFRKGKGGQPKCENND